LDVIKGLTETFLAENKAEIIDPLGLEERIKELETSIEEFTTNINWVLSETNSKTMITV
jgi:archaellum component FlaC